ncbi:MAG: tetratricopeptide repeat protein [Syntrophales bacterium]
MTEDVKKAGDIASILKKFNECKKHLKHGDVYHCLLSYKEALEKLLSSSILPADLRELTREINEFQASLQESKMLKDVFGPVTFKDSDPQTALKFVLQLLKVQEQEMFGTLGSELKADADFKKKIDAVTSLIDGGDYDKAREKLSADDRLSEYIAVMYNKSAIQHRKDGNFDKAMEDYQKALLALPQDEGLYYNIARLRVEKKEWKLARESIQAALKINPEFKEGKDLLKYIENQSALTLSSTSD